jgi:hypothetical protein
MFTEDFMPFVRRFLLLVLIILGFISLVGCSNPLGQPDVRVKISSLPIRIVLAASGATVEVLAEEFIGVKIDSKDLLSQIFPAIAPTNGAPSGNNPVLMIVNKKTNDIMYWQLTDKVKTVSLKHASPGAIELKIVNESPLRVELWIEGDIKSIDVDIQLKDE